MSNLNPKNRIAQIKSSLNETENKVYNQSSKINQQTSDNHNFQNIPSHHSESPI